MVPVFREGEPVAKLMARMCRYDHINGIKIALPPKRQNPASEMHAKFVPYEWSPDSDAWKDRAIMGIKYCHKYDAKAEFEEQRAKQSHIMRK